MPKIPQYEATAELKPNNMAAESYAQLGYHGERLAQTLSSNFQEAANRIGQGVMEYNEHQDQAQTASMLNDMSNLTVQAHQDLNSTMNNYDPSKDGDPVQTFNDKLSSRLEAIGN